MKKLASHMAVAAVLASGSVLAAGQTLLEDIAVSAEVTAACSALTASDVDFGAAGAADTDQGGTSTITVTCNTGTPYTVELDYGMNPQGGTQRVLTGAGGALGEQMLYDISQDAGHTIPWGDIANGDQVDGTGNGSVQTLTAYFMLHRTSGSSPGTYTDLVSVTLNF